MRAQIGLEYMAVVTLMIALLVPLFYIANQRLEVSSVSSRAKVAVSTIVTYANTIYAQSPGSKLTANVYVPIGYNNATSYIANRTILMHFDLTDGRPYDVFGITKGNVSGRLPPYPGYHVMTFTMNQSGWVIINTTAK